MKTLASTIALFLSLFSHTTFADNILDETLSCHGTEPFWALKVELSTAQDLNAPVVHELTFSILGSEEKTQLKNEDLRAAYSANDRSIFFISSQKNQPSDFGASFDFRDSQEELCNDGMSDIMYPYSTTLRLGDAVYSGCCSSNIYPARQQ